ncbi:hypothetical protein [Arthrobacter tumbae]|uniref:hypothetical protein n=1 Tax=Arthrobacter tumbae TaxID=163874 RepID=UPI00195C644E|nr:hypothetical protein [Arthrobacter tumbae]MBM7782564.1 hypothetical protein [Arthrobacter tumbae]
MTHYLKQTKTQAAAAFQEFLDERGPALVRLREMLAADGQNPDALLDGTVESLVPLWQWTLKHLTGPQAPSATDPASVPRDEWPSWERYTWEEELVLSMESVRHIDGLVSYLAQVVQHHAPAARWAVARHKVKRYAFNNHPVLVSEHTESNIFLPSVPVADARAGLKGMRELRASRIADYARAVIADLSEKNEAAGGPIDEPLVEVEDLGNHPLRGRELELSVREDTAGERSSVVDQLAVDLGATDGITGVVREDREVLLIATSTWTPTQLREWASRYLEGKLDG